ncbi:MAG: energy transducer TonB [Candidatus Eisenbacteria bacterium]|nr:energy transducer TonB [Candidatus Eisenbacteria bacterium]
MNRPRVTLYEFVPYGAPELLEVRDTHLIRALATASTGLVILFALLLAASAWLARHAGERFLPDPVVVTLEPPPTLEPVAPLPTPPTAPRISPAGAAHPVPVPDATAPPEAPIASQDELRRSDAGAATPSDGGVATPAPPADEAVPGLRDFVLYDEPPAVVTQVKPEYPEIALEAGVDGTVRLRVLVGRDGRVKDVHVDRSVALLDEAAVAAARQWVFTPALSNGHPVMVWVAVPIRFSLR